jgi:predicted lipoprotein with Yx(FWY)xxD motif
MYCICSATFPLTQKKEDHMKNFYSVLFSSIVALLLSIVSLTALAQAPAKVSNGILTTDEGMTLYVFDKDPSGKSVCNGPCAANWPPLAAQDSDTASGDYTIITREDGKKQWALKGKPLYTWSKDQKPGDKTGDGFKNIWHVAKP